MKRLFIATAAIALSLPSQAWSQGTQAIRSIGNGETNDARDAVVVAAGKLQGQLVTWRTMRARYGALNRMELAPTTALMDQLIALGDNALARQDNPREFAAAMQPLNALAGSAEAALTGRSLPPGIDGLPRLSTGDLGFVSDKGGNKLVASIPAITQYVPDVVFVLGLSVHTPFKKDSAGVPLTLSTNLLGALGAGVFDAVGVPVFATYLKNNVSVGTALYAGRAGKPSTDVSLGLGEWRTRWFTIWPVLGIEQADTADSRVPAALLAADTLAAAWSTPYLSIGIVKGTPDAFKETVGKGKILPVWTIGVRLPHHYPGGGFEAMSALFGEKISKFRRAGGAELFVGVSIPLLKVKAPTAPSGT